VVKWQKREALYSTPSSADVKNEWGYFSTPPVRLHGVVLVKAQGQLLPFTQLVKEFTASYETHSFINQMGTSGSVPGDKAAGA